MRCSSSYTSDASRSKAAGSPPVQALNRTVTSADRGRAITIPQKSYHGHGRFYRPFPPLAVEVVREMNTKRLVAILSITGASLCADQSANPQKGVVTVCMDSEPSVRV